MPLPPEPVLRAAVRWLERLPASGYRRCRALFSTLPEYSDITLTQYDTAYSWLTSTGLLNGGQGNTAIREQVFQAALTSAAWFSDADALIRSPDELPTDALNAAEVLGLSSAQAFQRIHISWGKVDAESRSKLGAAGEAALVDLLDESVSAQIDHVSQRSDGYGYDIEVQGELCRLHIEAKATYRRQRIVVYLSRHEYETMVYDPAWQLVVIRISGNGEAEAVCSVSAKWIKENVPQDRGVGGRWESCRLSIPPTQARSGIVRLAPLFISTRSPLIDGSVEW
ncbi:protein NO VEIN domain-containing protein [Actinomadura madurae]|uniref:protein NO VEIN domain-containing protein n=1 Tax=Actinomadura madurae TaxID=1993 RepID=UPI000D8CAE99|nr:DUF3883 domain-containing protein [Actinomadura madurae]SPT60527.1 Uncharacterised protein [Actinomadura madurae]